MFYKHWKKIALALTGFFWNSCDNGPTAVETGGATPSSSSNGNNESSSSAVVPASSSTPLYGVMSSAVQLSSSSTESSSSFERIMPAYGVMATCYEDGKGVKTNDETNVTKLICDDGVVCKETEVIKGHESEPCSEGFGGVTICPDYGIVVVSEKTYECNGIKFNEAEFRSRYDRKYTTKPESSSSAEESSSSEAQSSSSYNICYPEGYFCENRTEKYTESQAISDAIEQAKWDGSGKIGEIIREQFKDKGKDVPKCLQDMSDSLDKGFIALYGAPACSTPSKFRCTDGTTYSTQGYLEQLAFDEEQKKKKPQYDKKYDEVYKEETEKFDKAINECLNSEESKE